MSDTVTLELRTPLDGPLDASEIAADRFAALDEREIAALRVWHGARAAQLGEFFAVTGGRAARVVVTGSTRHVDHLGERMAGGDLIIEGDAGRGLAARMSGGAVEVHGSVGDDAGAALAGGSLRVHGSAGDRLGAAAAGASKGMTGGEIVVTGAAGAEVAARARRGLVVCGSAGERAARSIIAGSVIVLGDMAGAPGVGGKRGTVVAVGVVEVPATYNYACTYRPPHVRLTMTYLRRRYGVAIDDRVAGGLYRRYCGDADDVGKGEILQWVAE